MIKVSVIIPTIKGREEMLQRLMETISMPGRIEVMIVRDEDILLAAKRNKGAKEAEGEYFLFIDDDNYLAEGAIENCLNSFFYRVGIVGLVACYDNRPKHVADGGSKRFYTSGFMYGMNTNRIVDELGNRSYEVDEVANAFMIHSETFYELHGFDEKNFPIDLDEADLCKRVKDKGYKIMMCPTAICYHKSQTYSWVPDFRRPRNAYFMGRNRILFQKKHLSKFKLWIFFIFFFPVFVVSYCLSLLYRKKPEMIFHFLKGVLDGTRNRFENQYQ